MITNERAQRRKWTGSRASYVVRTTCLRHARSALPCPARFLLLSPYYLIGNCRIRQLLRIFATLCAVLLTTVSAWSAERPAEKVLNNLVTEIVNARQEGLLGRKTIPFESQTRGRHHVAVEGPVMLWLDNEPRPLCAGQHPGLPAEAMRHLPRGAHSLAVTGHPSQISVRKIPILQHAFYHAGDRWNVQHGPMDDWDFLQKHFLPNVNVIISVGSDNPPGYEEALESGIRWISNAAGTRHYGRKDYLLEWKRLGRHWLTTTINPFRERTDVTADEAYETWSRASGLNDPLFDGVLIDEFGGGDQPKYTGYRQALEKIYANPQFEGKTCSPYSYASGILSNDLSRDFARAAVQGGGHLHIERYLVEQPTRQAASEHIHQHFQPGWNMPRYNQDFPGVVQHTVMVLGYMSAVGESLNVDPGVDFKVYMDLQMHALATQTAYKGLGGLQQYTCSYADAETVRWASRLFRHYAIEGNTNLLSEELGYDYELTHIQNQDFMEGTSA